MTARKKLDLEIYPGQTGNVGSCRTGFKFVATRQSDSVVYFLPESGDIHCFPFISTYRMRRIPIGFIQLEPIRSHLRICSYPTWFRTIWFPEMIGIRCLRWHEISYNKTPQLRMSKHSGRYQSAEASPIGFLPCFTLWIWREPVTRSYRKQSENFVNDWAC